MRLPLFIRALLGLFLLGIMTIITVRGVYEVLNNTSHWTLICCVAIALLHISQKWISIIHKSNNTRK